MKSNQEQNHIGDPECKSDTTANQTAARSEQNNMQVAVKPKSKKKKKRKVPKYANEGGANYHHQYGRPLGTLSQHPPWGQAPFGAPPVNLGAPPLNLTHSQPETFLEQHLVRRYSLPTEQMPGIYPVHRSGKFV